MFLQMPSDNAVWTNHHAGPTADAFIALGYHHTFFGTPDGTGDTGMHAGRILAMTA
jgi:hypothetical protein